MIDCVQSYHTSAYTCGVAKWNLRLARELGVPLLKLGMPGIRPLISVKPSEIHEWEYPYFKRPYDLILHGWHTPKSERERMRNRRWVNGADRIWTVAPETLDLLQCIRPDVAVLPCPSTVETPRPRGRETYLTFGMAHKTTKVLQHYEAFRDAHAGEDYTILLSVGVHEGSPWDDALESSATALRHIFGAERVEVLGFLSDAALHREIERATACVAFYDPALRANNTTAWAVLERGKRLITNRDEQSPTGLEAPQWSQVSNTIGAVLTCAS
jgi:hypothetical protein